MDIKSIKIVDVRKLAWELRKALTLNCGGYNETGGVAQTGSMQYSERDGLTLTIPDGTPAAPINAVIAAHVPGPLPFDFPTDPPKPPDPIIAERATWLTATAVEKLSIIGKRFGLE